MRNRTEKLDRLPKPVLTLEFLTYPIRQSNPVAYVSYTRDDESAVLYTLLYQAKLLN